MEKLRVCAVAAPNPMTTTTDAGMLPLTLRRERERESIMLPASKTVHVFSVIPRLSYLLREKLPDVEVVEVKLIGNIDGKYPKKVLQEEVAALQEAEILLVDNSLLVQVAEQLPNVLWAQGTWAGVEGLVAHFKDKPRPTFPITRMASESFSQLMAEYAVGWIISHERGLLDCRMYQLKSEWGHKGNIVNYRSLRELAVGVLGMGIIGKEVARSLKSFNTTVHAYTRTAPTVENKSNNVDKYWHTGELLSFLQQCDYMINIMPSTPETRGMLGNDTLKDAKKDAVFINIGRGDVINEADIIKALDYGWISAAILDVFVQEPLSPESLLWKHPKVMITPHSSGISRAVDVAEAFVANFRRYTQGFPIQNTLDFDRGY
ncbi:glyoxylate/hydroxypyruvate reductase A [Procambarus clarkii]|uniref:glyoxylate/hydroxypyruvate reductase A n=1 Tax=Procambarus clarkii TaxID=6728 RepID=UPI00374409FF